MPKTKYQFTITYESTIDTDTGEILDTIILSKSNPVSKKSKVKDNETTPKLYLEENKYRLNCAAVELMGVQPDDKLDIKYEESGNKSFPIIGSDECFGTHSGNRLTQSLTVAFRGSKNIELSKFGKEFTIVAHPNKDGLFVLSTGEIPDKKEEFVGDDNIQLDLEDLNLESAEEVDSSIFNFNL